MMALTSALTATILLFPIVVMAQDVAIITIRARENATNLYRIGFSEDTFNSFHSCVFASYATCTVSFSGEGCTAGTAICSAVFAKPLAIENNGNKPYYKCKIDQSGTAMTCQKQDESQFQGATMINTYTIRNFNPLKCVGLVWTLGGESITFVENLLPVEECGNDCSCTSLVSTPQPATPMPTTPQPATPQPAKPGSATTSTAKNIGSPTTEFLRSSKSSGGDEPAPAAVIVGAVLGVIVAALVIVICVFVWIRRN